jgi:hypothetical protein
VDLAVYIWTVRRTNESGVHSQTCGGNERVNCGSTELGSVFAMKELTEGTNIEARWPVVVAIVALVSLLTVLPVRIRTFPGSVPFLVAMFLIVPMVALT